MHFNVCVTDKKTAGPFCDRCPLCDVDEGRGLNKNELITTGINTVGSSKLFTYVTN